MVQPVRKFNHHSVLGSGEVDCVKMLSKGEHLCGKRDTPKGFIWVQPIVIGKSIWEKIILIAGERLI